MAEASSIDVAPKGYVGRHKTHRPKRLRLVKRIYEWTFGREEHVRATVSDVARIPDDRLFADPPTDTDTIMAEAIRMVERRKAELADYMIPYVNALDEIMARFRAGLATV